MDTVRIPLSKLNSLLDGREKCKRINEQLAKRNEKLLEENRKSLAEVRRHSKMVEELRGKVSKLEKENQNLREKLFKSEVERDNTASVVEPSNGVAEEAIGALRELGLKASEAKEAVGQVYKKGMTVEELIQSALSA